MEDRRELNVNYWMKKHFAELQLEYIWMITSLQQIESNLN